MKNKIINWLMLRAWRKMLKHFDEFYAYDTNSFFMCVYISYCSPFEFIRLRMKSEINDALYPETTVFGMLLQKDKKVPCPPYLYCNMWREQFIMNKIKEYENA